MSLFSDLNNLTDFEDKEVDNAFFDKFSLKDFEMAGLLFQTGYLTIKSVKQRQYELRYTLGYPNVEVQKSMMHNLVVWALK